MQTNTQDDDHGTGKQALPTTPGGSVPTDADGGVEGEVQGCGGADDMSCVAPMSTRIQVLRASCEALVGVRKFDAVYDYLLTVPDHVTEEAVRAEVTRIVGDEELSLQVVGQAQVIVAYETFANG